MRLANLFRAETHVRKMVSEGLSIAIVSPCYNVQAHIVEVVTSLPDYVQDIILVNDASLDDTPKIIEQLREDGFVQNKHCHTVHLAVNQGVGGAVLAGFEKALSLKSNVIVKMDGDGQMDPANLPLLIEPLVIGKADYTKGNRLLNALTLVDMPLVRRLGNAVLSFLIKISSGYWNIVDPVNGYFALRWEVLEILPFNMIHKRFFFESSMLIALRIIRAVVLDIPMDARYGIEKSNIKLIRVLIEFPWELTKGFLRRVWLTKILYSLTIEAILGLCGFALVSVGIAYGVGHVLFTPTVILSSEALLAVALPLFLGFQMLMNGALLDIQSVPTTPLCECSHSKAECECSHSKAECEHTEWR